MSTPVSGSNRVLIIVQNLPVPLDRRVWLEAQALRAAGYEVAVICPKGPGDPARQEIDGVSIYKYTPAPEARGVAGFAWEFAYSWARTAALSVQAWREGHFQVIQACNPPDTYWLLARLWAVRGVTFVFDQHDLNPELFISRFGPPTTAAARMQYAGLKWLERQTYATAARVISTNESYRRIALERGGLGADDVTVVRSGPDTRRMRPIAPAGRGWRGGDSLLVYLGIMGPQDNVNVLLDVMQELRQRGRNDVRMALLGFGDCLEDLRAEATTRGLDPWVEFTGRVGPTDIAEYLSSADVGMSPDLKTPLNDASTMNKTMEYMAYGLPSVSFDLVETRVSGGDCVVYVPDGDVAAFADAVESLLDDPARRTSLGRLARERVAEVLDWRPQAEAYVSVFDRLLGRRRSAGVELVAPVPPSGQAYIDLRDPRELDRFIETRNRPERSRAEDSSD